MYSFLSLGTAFEFYTQLFSRIILYYIFCIGKLANVLLFLDHAVKQSQ